MSMTTRPGYYCLVQFCPNPSRLEAANLGVLVYCPETKTHRIEFAKEPGRLRRIFKGVELDIGRIDHAKTMLQDRLSREIDLFSGVADLVQFIDTRTGNLRLTHPRPMQVGNLDADIRDLFHELVTEKAHSAGEARDGDPTEKHIKDHLRRTFGPMIKQGRAERKREVIVPSLEKKIEIPYAYRNGRLNLVNPAGFPLGVAGERKLSELALEGDLIQKFLREDDQEASFIVIPWIKGETLPSKDSESLRNKIQRVFGIYQIRTVAPDAIESFLQSVEQQAH